MFFVETPSLTLRARRHAALGDRVRLAIFDELSLSDRAPVELAERFDLPSNLLAHHLDVLEGVGLIGRHRSSGDGRRRYVHLLPDAFQNLALGHSVAVTPAMFVCKANSARSQLAAALWADITGAPGSSAGTHPAESVHRGAIAAASRVGLDLSAATPTALDVNAALPPLVVTVCDQAHEELGGQSGWLHWSIPDPVSSNAKHAFDDTVVTLRERITQVVSATGAVA